MKRGNAYVFLARKKSFRRKKCLRVRILMYKPPPRSPRARSFRARRSFVIRRSLAAGRVRHRGGVRRGGRGLAVHGLRRVLGRRRVLGLLPVLRLHRHRRGGLHGVLGLRAALDGVELLFSVARAAAHEGEDEERDQARDGAAVRLVHEVAGLAVDLEKEEKEEGGGGDVSDDAAGFRAKSRAAGSREKHARRPRGDGVGRAGTAGHAPRRTAPRAAWRPPHVVAPAASRQVRRASGFERRLSRVDVSATINTRTRINFPHALRVCGDAVPSWHVPAMVSAAKISCVFFFF